MRLSARHIQQLLAVGAAVAYLVIVIPTILQPAAASIPESLRVSRSASLFLLRLTPAILIGAWCWGARWAVFGCAIWFLQLLCWSSQGSNVDRWSAGAGMVFSLLGLCFNFRDRESVNNQARHSGIVIDKLFVTVYLLFQTYQVFYGILFYRGAQISNPGASSGGLVVFELTLLTFLFLQIWAASSMFRGFAWGFGLICLVGAQQGFAMRTIALESVLHFTIALYAGLRWCGMQYGTRGSRVKPSS